MIKIRKIQSLILAMVLLTGWSAAVLVDDFESYNLGAVNTVAAPNWVAGADNGTSPSTASIVVDPVDSANHVLQLTEGGGTSQQWMYNILSPTATIADGTTSTMYVRFKTTAAIDESFGLTDLDVPGADWNHFRIQFVVHNAIQIRDGGSTRTLARASTGAVVPFNTDWYNLWIVVNNSTDTVSLYLNQTDADATEADRLVRSDLLTQNTFAFRSAAGALDRFFWRAQNNANTRMVMIDDLCITNGTNLTIPAGLGAFNPSPANGATDVLTTATLSWNTGIDPANPGQPNPAITKHYISFRKGDPNLAYPVHTTLAEVNAAGATGSWTPPTTGLNAMALDGTYYWRIDEGVNNSSRSDPNTIRGSLWSFAAQKSIPVITQQPADVRVFASGPNADPNAVFTVTYTYTGINLPTATWYKNGVAIIPDGVNVKVTTTMTSSKLEIKTPELSVSEGKYYCVLSVDPAITTDDVQTATRLLVIKTTLAQFDFENNLNDSSGNSAPAGLAKYVSPSDPNEMKAASATLSYVPGKQGQAVSLSTGQYVDFGTAGYPKAGPLDTLGDIRGAGYEKTGFGRGMDQGSILCWVKPNSTGVIYGNANTNAAPGTDDTHFGLSTTSTNNARIIVRGENYDGGYQEIGTASGSLNMTDFSLQDGQWHMFAATWENDTVRVYINGEQVATNTAGTPEKYNPWERGNLLGVSRTANRWILSSADFLTGAIDSLRVYNYVISADAIAMEYKTLSGNTPCTNHSFAGNAYNFDNTASSYCKVDIGDFVMFASQWLNCGLYPDCP